MILAVAAEDAVDRVSAVVVEAWGRVVA